MIVEGANIEKVTQQSRKNIYEYIQEFLNYAQAKLPQRLAPPTLTPNKHRLAASALARHNILFGHCSIVACKQFNFAFCRNFSNFLSKMSDDGSTAVEKKGRGRPKANGTQPEAKGDSKKRGRPAVAPAKSKESKNSSDDEQAPIAKRGRGRPKGSKKKAAAPKGKSGSGEGRGRGRPRKDAPPPKKDAASTEEEQEDEEEEEGSDQ